MSTPANALPAQARFESFRASPAPWDIGKPQAPFIAITDRVVSSALDAGYGTGENALFFAFCGHQVTGIDFAKVAIERVRSKAAERGLSAQFLVKDALTLASWQERLAAVIDCDPFHVFSDKQRQIYVDGLGRVTAPGGRLFLMCFSSEEPKGDGHGAFRVRTLCEAFAEGWEIESTEPARFEINPECKDLSFSEGGPKAWFATIRCEGD